MRWQDRHRHEVLQLEQALISMQQSHEQAHETLRHVIAGGKPPKRMQVRPPGRQQYRQSSPAAATTRSVSHLHRHHSERAHADATLVWPGAGKQVAAPAEPGRLPSRCVAARHCHVLQPCALARHHCAMPRTSVGARPTEDRLVSGWRRSRNKR